MFGIVLVILIVLTLAGVLPRRSYSRTWSYYPGGGLGLLIAVVVRLLLIGRIW